MSKDEFASIITEELEKLEEQLASASNTAKEYMSNPNSEEYRSAKYFYDVVSRKKNAIVDKVKLPLLLRIQKMSDIEAEEYKRSQIEQLKLEKGEDSPELTQLVEQIHAKTPQVIREEMIAQIEGLDRRLVGIKTFNKSANLLVELSERQPYNVPKVASLLSRYNFFSELQSKQQTLFIREPNLPVNVSGNLFKTKYIGDSDIDKMFGVIDDYETKLDATKARFLQMCAPDNIKKLAESETERDFEYDERYGEVLHLDNLSEKKKGLNELYKYNVDVDLEFLDKHADKIDNYSRRKAELQKAIAIRNKLSSKIFKNMQTKQEICSLNASIASRKNMMYYDIRNWYSLNTFGTFSQGGMLRDLDIYTRLDFSTVDSLRSSVEEITTRFEDRKARVEKQKRSLESARETLKQARQRLETTKSEFVDQIKALVGEEFVISDVYTSNIPEDNMNRIAGTTASVYQSELYSRVANEAQTQADIREAEIRGISVEELQQMKAAAPIVINEADMEELQGPIR